jgi:hypothetical protein
MADEREWAAAELPRLLEQALAEALAEAKEILRRRHVDALLDAARPRAPGRAAPTAARPAAAAPADAEPTGSAPDAEPTGSAPDAEPTGSTPAGAEPADSTAAGSTERRSSTGSPGGAGTGLWVYGVVDGEAPDPDRALAGVDGAAVQAIRAAGVAALASPVPLDRFRAEALEASLEDLQRLEALARAHQHVLDRALEAGGVIPFRLCTIYDGAAHVREMLERERESLTATLERVRGAAEWGVKAYLVAAPAPAPAAAPAGAARREREREDRAAAESAREAAEHRAATIHARLGEHAAASALSRPHDRRLSGHEGEMLLNAAYLVASARAADFHAVVDALAREHEPDGLRLELTGPWAPYHFVGGDA